MGSNQTYYPPQYPVLLTNIYEWGKRIVDYLRAVRPIAGGRIRLTQSPSGTIISADPQDLPIGSITATMADIYGVVAGDSRHTELMNEIKSRGFLPCDGSTVNVADYPRLAWALGADTSGLTFDLPDLRGRMLMGWDNRGTPDPHSDFYNVQSVGGYRRHGQTENNHHDHTFDIDLDHDHGVQIAQTTICTGLPIDDVCETGLAQDVLIPSGPVDTDPPQYPADDDRVPSPPEGFTPPQGEIGRAGIGDEIVQIRLKHYGDDGVYPNAGEGNILDDVDNRPPYMVVNWIIKAS